MQRMQGDGTAGIDLSSMGDGLMKFYPLTKEKMASIQEHIAEIKAQNAKQAG